MDGLSCGLATPSRLTLETHIPCQPLKSQCSGILLYIVTRYRTFEDMTWGAVPVSGLGFSFEVTRCRTLENMTWERRSGVGLGFCFRYKSLDAELLRISKKIENISKGRRRYSLR